MSDIIINEQNLSRFTKRLHKALNALGLDLKLHQATDLFSKALGKDNESELKKVLKKEDNQDAHLTTIYVSLNNQFIQDIEQKKLHEFQVSTDYVDIYMMYSATEVDDLFYYEFIEGITTVKAKIKQLDLIASTSAMLSGDHWGFNLYFDMENGKFIKFQPDFKQKHTTF